MACAWASPRPSAALAAPRGTPQFRKAAACIVRAPAPSGRPQLLQQRGARQRLTRPAAWGRNARDWAPPPRDQLGWDASDDDYDTDEDLDLFPEEVGGLHPAARKRPGFASPSTHRSPPPNNLRTPPPPPPIRASR